jgi:hypothetical protein
MRVEVAWWVAAVAAFATAIAQWLAIVGRIEFNHWPLLRNPDRRLRIAYVGLLCLAAAVAVGTGLGA